MRKALIALMTVTLLVSNAVPAAHARACTDDTLIEKFGDWFGNIGKSSARKQRNISARKAHKLADCKEKESRLVRGTATPAQPASPDA